MAEAPFWGLVGASALVIGAEVAFAFKLSRMVIGLIMAFGVGALISAVSFELVAPAMEDAEAWKVVLGLALGSAAFFIGDRAIATMGGAQRKNPDGDSSGDSGLGIVLGTVLDGITESAVLDMSLVEGGGVSIALLAGIWVSNFPESLGSTVSLTKGGWEKRKIRLLWLGIALVSGVSAAVGYVVVNNASALRGVLVESFAAVRC